MIPAAAKDRSRACLDRLGERPGWLAAAVLAGLGLALAAAGCQPSKPQVRPGVLTISQEQVGSWIRNFNPLIPGGTARWPTLSGIYEPLFVFNAMTSQYVPWLATGYQWQDGNQTLEMMIRTKVLWSDGTPFSAADVAFTFNLLRQHPGLDVRRIWNFLESVEVEGDSLVRFAFSRTYVPGLDSLAGQPIVPRHIWSEIEDPVKFSNPQPVATGPFTEVLRFDTQVWELGRNPRYWQKGKPAVEALRFPAFPSNEQVTLALINGEIDWAGNFIPAIDRIFVKRDPEHHHYWFPRAGGSIFLYPNHTRPPLDRVEVRKALSLAIDRDQVVRVAMHDYTIPAHPTALADGMQKWRSEPATREGDWVAFDPERAEAMLDQAGYCLGPDGQRHGPDGTALTLQLNVVTGWSDWMRAAQVISQNLKRVGITAQVKNHDFGAWFSQMQKAEFDLSIGWAEKGPTPYPLYRGLMSAELVRPVGEVAETNWHRFGLEEMDSLCRTFEQTSDPEESLKLVHRMQELFVQHAPAIPLFAEPSWGEFNTSRFTGFPSQENPFAQISPNSIPENLLVLVALKPR